MATREEVKMDMQAQFYHDNPQRLFQAGATWVQQALGFYYAGENGVDLAMKQILLRILRRENKSLPADKWNETRIAVNRATVVNNAIDSLTNIAAYARSEFNL